MDTLFQGIAIVALLLGNVLLIMVGFIAARRSGRIEGGGGSTREAPLVQELKSVSLSLAALSERLVKLEIQIAQLRDQAGQHPLPLNREAEQKSFKVATKLALQGASVDELVELCGLARGEAELICMLHSSNQVSPTGVAGQPTVPSLQKGARVKEESPPNERVGESSTLSLRKSSRAALETYGSVDAAESGVPAESESERD